MLNSCVNTRGKQILAIPFSACKCNYFSQITATNKTRAGGSRKYAIVIRRGESRTTATSRVELFVISQRDPPWMLRQS